MSLELAENVHNLESIISEVFTDEIQVSRENGNSDQFSLVQDDAYTEVWFAVEDTMNSDSLFELYVGIEGVTKDVPIDQCIASLQIMQQRSKYLEKMVPDLCDRANLRDEGETDRSKEFFYAFPLADKPMLKRYLEAVRDTVLYMTTTRSILLANQYTEIKVLKKGGTRTIYQAKFGSGNEHRIVKEDLSQLDSPRALRHTDRGYNTAYEYEILGLVKDWNVPQLNRMVDIVEFPILDGVRTLTIYDEFKKSDGSTARDLDEEALVGFTDTEIQRIFSDSLIGLKTLHEEVGIYHRDIKPSNVLVRRNSKNTRAQITDYANAVEIGKVKERTDSLPTMGGHHSLDPLCLEGKAFDATSDLYGLGKTMLFAATGEYIFEIDPDNNIALNNKTGESLYHNGRIDSEAYGRAVETSLEKVSPQYRRILKRMLSLDENERYQSASDVQLDLAKITKKTVWERIAPHLPKTILGLGLIAGITTATVASIHDEPNVYTLPEFSQNVVYDEMKISRSHIAMHHEVGLEKMKTSPHHVSDFEIASATNNVQVAFLLEQYAQASKESNVDLFTTNSQIVRLGQNHIYRHSPRPSTRMLAHSLAISSAIGISFEEQNRKHVDIGDVVSYTLLGPNEVHKAMRETQSYEYPVYSKNFDSHTKQFADLWLNYINTNK